jgi:hypothetical protein
MKNIALIIGMIVFSSIGFSKSAKGPKSKGGLLYGDQCKLSKNSPSSEFPLYYKIDKIIFPDLDVSEQLDDATKLPFETKSVASVLVLNSDELGGGMFVSVLGKARAEMVTIKGDKQLLITSLYTGQVSARGDNETYSVSAARRYYILDGDHGYDFDFKMMMKESSSGKVHEYFFECDAFDQLKDQIKP